MPQGKEEDFKHAWSSVQEFSPKDCGIKLQILACHYANGEDEKGEYALDFKNHNDRLKSRSFRS